MSLIKFNNRYGPVPLWNNDRLKDFLSSNEFFNNDFFDDENNTMPAMNVKDHDDDFEIEFAAPGFSKKDFDVTIDGDMLIVCAHKKYDHEQKEDAYSRKEFSYSSFKRSIKLPQSVNVDQDVKATYRNGILKLNLQKKDMSKDQHKILIKVL